MTTATITPVTAAASRAKIERRARLRWVPISLMQVSPLGQRALNHARVDKLIATWDMEQIGTPTVSLRDGIYWVIDGQHRIEALRELGHSERQIQCWCYEGLSEAQEADEFLKLNDTLTVSGFQKYKIALQAGRDEESDIDRIVRAVGLHVSLQGTEGAIRAVGTLRRVYHRGVLARTLRIIEGAYGDAGLEAHVIDGIGLLCQRYEAEADDGLLVKRLGGINGGVNGLTGRATQLRRMTGNQKGQCVAAAAVECYNRGRGSKKLPDWWRTTQPPAPGDDD